MSFILLVTTLNSYNSIKNFVFFAFLFLQQNKNITGHKNISKCWIRFYPVLVSNFKKSTLSVFFSFLFLCCASNRTHQTQTGQPFKYRHHFSDECSFTVKEGGGASASFLKSPPQCFMELTPHRCIWFQHRIEEQRLASPPRMLLLLFLVSSVGIEHRNKMVNWSSSSLVS